MNTEPTDPWEAIIGDRTAEDMEKETAAKFGKGITYFVFMQQYTIQQLYKLIF